LAANSSGLGGAGFGAGFGFAALWRLFEVVCRLLRDFVLLEEDFLVLFLVLFFALVFFFDLVDFLVDLLLA